jgi:hypothetical protein
MISTFLLLSLRRYLCWWTISPWGIHHPEVNALALRHLYDYNNTVVYMCPDHMWFSTSQFNITARCTEEATWENIPSQCTCEYQSNSKYATSLRRF